jgi:macrodomain Ter protein organizer (MatP/YcbG family)
MTCGDQGLSKKTKTKQASEHQQLPERQPVPQQSEEPPWKRHLDQQLEKNAEQRKMRRYNAEKVDAVEEALKVAIQVRFRMDEIADREDAYVEHIIEHLLEGAMEDYTAKRLWDYLTGDPNNLISLRERKEMTEEWKEWLDETAPDSL